MKALISDRKKNDKLIAGVVHGQTLLFVLDVVCIPILVFLFLACLLYVWCILASLVTTCFSC